MQYDLKDRVLELYDNNLRQSPSWKSVTARWVLNIITYYELRHTLTAPNCELYLNLPAREGRNHYYIYLHLP